MTGPCTRLLKLNANASDERIGVSFIVDFLERRGANVFVWPVKQDKDDNIEGNRIFYGPLRFTGHHELCLDAKDIKEMQQRQNILKKIYY